MVVRQALVLGVISVNGVFGGIERVLWHVLSHIDRRCGGTFNKLARILSLEGYRRTSFD